jgi:Mg2+ and Co2+ transporter CorA
LTISAYVLDKHTIKQTDFSNPIAIREEMVQLPEESLWIHGDEPEDIFPLQTIFGLHPLSVEAVTHQNQPSKIEGYDEYLSTIIDGVRYDEKEQNKNNSKPLTTKTKITNTTPTPTPTPTPNSDS